MSDTPILNRRPSPAFLTQYSNLIVERTDTGSEQHSCSTVTILSLPQNAATSFDQVVGWTTRNGGENDKLNTVHDNFQICPALAGQPSKLTTFRDECE